MFSEWDRIFKDPMTTAAAVDRLVHHSVILEMTGSSIRIEEAQAQAGRTEGGIDQNQTLATTTDNPIPDAAPTAPGPAPTTTTPTATTTSPSTTNLGAAPTAPGRVAHHTPHEPITKEPPTTDRRQQIKQRVHQRRSEADGEI